MTRRAGNIAAVRAYITSRQGDYPRTIALAEEALAQMPEDELFLRSMASYAWASPGGPPATWRRQWQPCRPHAWQASRPAMR